jgi:hypothetical protein
MSFEKSSAKDDVPAVFDQPILDHPPNHLHSAVNHLLEDIRLEYEMHFSRHAAIDSINTQNEILFTRLQSGSDARDHAGDKKALPSLAIDHNAHP